TESRRMDEDLTASSNTVMRDADRALLARYSPPAVVVNDAMDIVQFRGRTSEFLAPAPGRPSFNLLKMVREGLFADLRSAIAEARKNDLPVKRPAVHVTNEIGSMIVDVEVVPFLSGSKERYYLVLFDNVRVDPAGEPLKAKGKTKTKEKASAPGPIDSRQVARLKRELEATREY